MQTQLNTLTTLECDKLLRELQAPQETTSPPRVHHRNYTMALVMLDAGLRVGELIQLRQDQLWYADAPVKALTVEKDQAKNKHERTVPTTIRLRDAIDQMRRTWWDACYPQSDPIAFYRTNPSNPLTPRQVQRIIKGAGTKAIGREIHPHLLRHTFATRLMRVTSMRVVQEFFFFNYMESTEIYTHPNNEDRQKAIDALNENE